MELMDRWTLKSDNMRYVKSKDSQMLQSSKEHKNFLLILQQTICQSRHGYFILIYWCIQWKSWLGLGRLHWLVSGWTETLLQLMLKEKRELHGNWMTILCLMNIKRNVHNSDSETSENMSTNMTAFSSVPSAIILWIKYQPPVNI